MAAPPNVVDFGPRRVSVWPQRQKTTALASEIHLTRFADTQDYHPGLIERALVLEERVRARVTADSRGVGGTKIHHLGRWNTPEASLINARATAFCRAALGWKNPEVDLSWANVFRPGDYIMPHSHHRARISVVYLVDPGEDDPADDWAGKFCFADPRLPVCCRDAPNHMTTPYFPRLEPGSMILFPGALVHFVTPYRGRRPRITLSWNLNPAPLPGAHGDAGVTEDAVLAP